LTELYDQIQDELKRGDIKPVYFLAGEEAFFIDTIVSFLENMVIPEEQRGFDQTVLYGKETDVATIIEFAKRFPMIAEKQLIVVKEAQHLRNIDQLESYLNQPQPTTVLVIAYKYKKVDKRKSFAKTLQKKAVFYESKKLYDSQVPSWIETWLVARNYRTNFKTAALLTEFLGNDLGRIANELQKLMIVLPPGSMIDEEAVETNIGISKDFNNFELQKALIEKNALKSYQIAQYFGANPRNNPLVVTVGTLYAFFSKLLIYHSLRDKNRKAVASSLGVNPYFVKDYEMAAHHYPLRKSVQIIRDLRKCDLRSKGVGNTTTTDAELLKELIYSILN
jgi:DNA polymerase-3 subunit delta